MLHDRNENKRLVDIASTKPQILPKHVNNYQKENKLPLNNPQVGHQTFKQPLQPVVEDPRRNMLITETNKIKTMNLKKILAYELSKSKGNYRNDFLEKHSLSSDIRTRMVSL